MTDPDMLQEKMASPRPEDSFAWKSKDSDKLFNATLPRVQSPTVTLLQKKRGMHEAFNCSLCVHVFFATVCHGEIWLGCLK